MMLLRNVAKWTLIICTIASIMQLCVSIKCYECRSDVNSRCYDLKGSEYLKRCEGNGGTKSICRTVTQLFYLTSKLDRFRECVYRNGSVALLQTHWIKNDVVNREVILCDSDGCNVATSTHKALPAWLHFLLMTRYVWLPILLQNA